MVVSLKINIPIIKWVREAEKSLGVKEGSAFKVRYGRKKQVIVRECIVYILSKHGISIAEIARFFNVGDSMLYAAKAKSIETYIADGFITTDQLNEVQQELRHIIIFELNKKFNLI